MLTIARIVAARPRRGKGSDASTDQVRLTIGSLRWFAIEEAAIAAHDLLRSVVSRRPSKAPNDRTLS